MISPTKKKLLLTKRGFTLVEVLVTITILGLIAAFAIPKVLVSQNDKANAIAKDVASTITNAYQSFRSNNIITGSTEVSELMPYINYASVNTTFNASGIDCTPGNAAENVCYNLHNSGVLYYNKWGKNFSGTTSNHALSIGVAPDDSHNVVVFFLYTDGRLRTYGTPLAATISAGNTYNPGDHSDPSWFNWQG